MKEKLKVGNAVGASMVFGSQKYARVDMDINVAMWFIRNANELEDIRALFEEKRRKLFNEYSIVKDKKRHVPKNKMPDFEEKISELMEEEIEVECHKISISALKDLKIAPMDLAAIKFAIAE